MATIGSFKKSENGDYAGTVKTLTLNVKARITPVEKTNEKAPDFRIYAGRTEIEFGAAWRKTSNEGREYLSVKLDDPSFPLPIYASLVEVEGAAKGNPSRRSDAKPGRFDRRRQGRRSRPRCGS